MNLDGFWKALAKAGQDSIVTVGLLLVYGLLIILGAPFAELAFGLVVVGGLYLAVSALRHRADVHKADLQVQREVAKVEAAKAPHRERLAPQMKLPLQPRRRGLEDRDRGAKE